MNAFHNRILVGITATVCVLIALASLLYYNKLSDAEAKETPSVSYNNGLGDIPQETRPSPVPTDSSLTPTSSSVEALPSQTPPSVSPKAEEEIVNDEEALAKLWFDLRGNEPNPNILSKLIKGIKEELELGNVPQIVTNFPLNLIDETDFGFQENILRTADGKIDLLTLVVPATAPSESRVITFVTKDSGSGLKTEVRSDLKIVPSNFGRQKIGSEYYFFVGGPVVDSKIFSDKGSIGLYVIKASGSSESFVGFKEEDLNLKYSDVLVSDEVLILAAEINGAAPFFYNEVENEGQTTDDLYVVTSSNEINSEMYIVEIESGLVNLSLVEKITD